MQPETRTIPAAGGAGIVQEDRVGTGSKPEDSATAGLPVVTPVQLALGETGMARRGDAVTSVDAARRVNFTKGCEIVLDALVAIGKDSTADDIADYLGHDVMMPNVVARRLTDLGRLDKALRLEPVQGRRGRSVHAWRAR